MFKVYAKKDQKLKIEIIGNKFNEKISEKLFYKHKVNRTSIKKVFTVRDQILNKEKFLNDLQKIISKINLLNDHNLKTSLNNLLKIK